jgi:membrane-bound lytic murein transglycosylase D
MVSRLRLALAAGGAWLLATACTSGGAVPPAAPAPAHPSAETTPAPLLPGIAFASQADSADVGTTAVMREAVEIFGDSAAPADSAVEPSWDIDVRSYETHERVEHYIGVFTGRAKPTFTEWLERGSRYDAMIRAKLRAAGLPEDLTYLALVESGYDPHAYSRAAAVGMWQFMTATARDVGLRVDWWVDERRDPVRSTEGAVKFLGWLREQFGSLYLAAAAYNGGPGRLSRGLARYADELHGATGDDAFFALADKDYLRSETKNYVPQIIAAALVAKEPERYGLTVRTAPPLEFDTARVGPATPLAAVALAAGVPLDTITALNPFVLRGVTPPRDSFVVRVPPGAGASVPGALRALPDSDRTAFARVTTKKGDTRATLARRAGITTGQLAWYNPGLRALRSGALVAGQTVLLPSRGVVAAARDVPDPAIERYGTSSARAGRDATHVVRRGETLGGIARRYGTSVATLMRLNGLKKSVIYAGQVIVVRGAAASTSRSARASTAARRPASAAPRGGAASATPRAPARSAAKVHVVRRGESLSVIARRYGTTVSALRALNGMTGDGIRAGQRLRVGD